MARAPNGYRKSVFINAPFSVDRRDIFNAIVFSVQACGFAPRCAREFDDAGQVRMDKIASLIRDCRLGIHDISFMELDDGVPRFNMPFELGVFLGACRFADGWVGRKACTIFDSEAFRYQRALSDIAGQDIRAHNCDPRRASDETRDWLYPTRFSGRNAFRVQLRSGRCTKRSVQTCRTWLQPPFRKMLS